ncbi:PH domain-containing protein [Streptomyces yaizuensis]|uniref:PH domain-containing protein n=1 Tax=Streptomyces yaizuensis TaxID=2989713 RepID=A0ABQ5P7Z1_9ACTN|nr:PH domain-containing protein [Streptomyces sp. YSPA8]GLF98603.1 PH domain-containing protein [Streptomyces sp. YSPA8]
MSAAGPEAPDAAEADEGWRRLDGRAPLVAGAVMTSVAAGVCPPVALLLLDTRWVGGPATTLALLLTGAVLLILGGAAAEALRLRRTRYRAGPGVVELHSGILLVNRRSLARERIRTVDLSAHPLLRLLGLVKVRIGTGERAGSGTPTLELNPVSRAEGERLRRELLGRGGAAVPGADHEGPLAALDPRWIRYAPLSFVAPTLGFAAAGAVMQVSDWFGQQGEVIERVGDLFRGTSVLTMVLVLLLAALLAGVVGSLGLWVEMWWHHRLEREPGGTLRVRRGLFTTRSISLEENRLRGVELVEPLGVRLAGAARVDAVAVGVGGGSDDETADLHVLLPAAPRAVAEAVAARVLREPAAPTALPLTAHPRAARDRRLRWALSAVLVPLAALAALGLWLTPVLLWTAGALALVALPLAVLLALDAYRSLGHGADGAFLLVRSGTFRRSTVVLRRDGVIGWVIRQSVFQRRAGVLTLTATTAAGAGGYAVRDADAGEGLAFAADAVPGLLAPFLEPPPRPAPRA